MITQRYDIRCEAPSAWLDPQDVFTAHDGKDGPLKCTRNAATEATHYEQARRDFMRRGWYIAESGLTYCHGHAETARRIDLAARRKAAEHAT